MMRALTIILVDPDRGRGDAAAAIAAAHAATGGPTHLHLDAGSIQRLADAAFVAGLQAACALGTTLTLCPTGLADAAFEPVPFPDAERIGLVALLAELDDAARLVVM